MPKCTINGRQYEFKEGMTIMQAFHENKVDIAYYCWHPGLSIAGVCRLCMVDIEGNPKLQIACNTQLKDGMVITNQNAKVKDSVKWGLDFHLINHPLDCPICDQAGECGLQEQYMQFGKYDPEMAERKVKKRKVVDLGPTVVLDTERCILCSRCVRFTDEVSKTHELGIFHRGDRSEIGTFEDKPLKNNYSLNTVDICPVGALTSKDFRFRQRVWYLKEAESVCPGCSTGCNIKVHYNKDGLFRVKPVYNKDINGHWMCDVGRDVYKFVNKETRMRKALKKEGAQTVEMEPGAAAKDAGQYLRSLGFDSSENLALVLTGQYTVEEYRSIVSAFANDFKTKNIYHWQNNPDEVDEFDGILFRGDRNPNTKGLQQVLAETKIKAQWSDLANKIKSGKITTVVVAGPENPLFYGDLAEVTQNLSGAKDIIWLAPAKNKNLDGFRGQVWQIPTKTFIEKDGTFVNFNGIEQKIRRGVTIVSEALTLTEVADLFAGRELIWTQRPHAVDGMVRNQFAAARGTL